ncbi:MAG: ADP-ribosylation factor-like protein [Promethearchaeota archaeon]
MKDQRQKSFFHIVSFSMFSDVKGPVPVYCYPDSISETTQVEIAMKSVSLLMGEAVYQTGLSNDLKFFGILPFPDLNYIGLTYFFLIPDVNARGKSKAATVTIVVEESNHHFIYDNIHTLRILLDKTRVKLRKNHEQTDIKRFLDTLRFDITHLHKNSEFSTPRSRMKILCAGFDNSGKSSFLKSIKMEFPELFADSGIQMSPAKEKTPFLSFIPLEWDFGGQGNYRTNYFKNAALYLHDIDLLYYFIDIQDLIRLDESMQYLSEILHTLENFNNSPIIQIVLHKYDPELEKSDQLTQKISSIQSTLLKLHSKWDMKVFLTSSFDASSISKCFSYGFSRLSPNTDKFTRHIKKFVKRLNGHVAVLLSNNALIIAEFCSSSNWHELVDNIRVDMLNMFRTGENNQKISQPYHSLQINGVQLIFYRMLIDSNEFFVVFDSENDKNKNERFVEKLKKGISPLIRSYLG